MSASDKVILNIKKIYNRKQAALYALCKVYAVRALKLFNMMQKDEEFWNNQTFQAKDSVFTDAYTTTGYVGFFIAHGKAYGQFLEFANDRKHEALRPIMNSLYKPFMEDVKKIYG